MPIQRSGEWQEKARSFLDAQGHKIRRFDLNIKSIAVLSQWKMLFLGGSGSRG